jgi:hypothetical protein
MKAVLLGVLIVLAFTSCTGSPTARAPERSAASPAVSVPTPEKSPDPAEHRAPVSLPCPDGAQPRVVVGARHRIVGDVFGWPLVAPPASDHNNKILWRSRHAGAAGRADLHISASLNGSGLRIQRRVDGDPTPGPFRPSIINVPQAGCWTFSLSWGHTRDVVAVRYR